MNVKHKTYVLQDKPNELYFLTKTLPTTNSGKTKIYFYIEKKTFISDYIF